MKFISYLFMMCLFLSCNISSRKEYTIDVINSSYEGQIIKKHIDNWNHAAKMIQVHTINNDTLNITVDFYPDSWNFVSVGDSIIKNMIKGVSKLRGKQEDEENFFYIFQIKKYLYSHFPSFLRICNPNMNRASIYNPF